MKNKFKKYTKLVTKSDSKMITIANSNNSTDNSNNDFFGNNFEQQNNSYPADIQGLFERLGIE